MIAYHGTPLENLHSILRSGFLNHFNTTALFGSVKIKPMPHRYFINSRTGGCAPPSPRSPSSTVHGSATTSVILASVGSQLPPRFMLTTVRATLVGVLWQQTICLFVCLNRPGTYLSSDLSVCMGFTRAGATWKKSGLGAKLSCVAVCQVIKHPAVKLPGGKTEHDLDRSSTVGGDRVPSTYGQKKKRIGNSASPLPPQKKMQETQPH